MELLSNKEMLDAVFIFGKRLAEEIAEDDQKAVAEDLHCSTDDKIARPDFL